MKKGPTLFLKIVICLMAVAVLAGLIWFPQTEGRAVNLNLISIYKDPLIIYIYLASIPFFIALFQAFKLLGYVDKNEVFSNGAVTAVRNIKYCALAIPVLIIGAQIFIVLNADGDDYAGPVALGIYASFVSVVIAASAAIFQKILQNATVQKSGTN